MHRAYRQPRLTDPERGWREADQAVDAAVRKFGPGAVQRAVLTRRTGHAVVTAVSSSSAPVWVSSTGPPRLVHIRPNGTNGMLHDTTSGWVVGIRGGSGLSTWIVARIMTTQAHDETHGGWPVALSDEEQRLLEQMEAALAAEDPKLVNALRGTGVRRVHRRRAAIAGVGFFVGLALLIAGIVESIRFLSVLGFVIMVAAAVTAIYSWQHVGTSPDPAAAAIAPRPRRAPARDGQDFMDKMEERWRRRRDEGF